MKLIGKIDGLLIFFLLSLAFVGLAGGLTMADLVGKEEIFKPVLNLENQLYASPNTSEEVQFIQPFNRQLKLYYSQDGGDHFLPANGALYLSDFENKELQNQLTSIRWRHPQGNFPKVKSVVVKLIDHEKKEESEPKVFTYFDPNIVSTPIVSLSIPESDLFDPVDGIMIYGKKGWSDTAFYKEWWYRSANFKERGREWEKEVNFQYFVNGKKVIDQTCGTRISGNATRYFPQKSLRLYAREEYGDDKIRFPFWEEHGNKKSESILLRNSGNDNTGTLFADLFIHNLCRNTEVMVVAGTPVSVFINGTYWGLYNLRERIDEYFIAQHFDTKSKEVTILEGGQAFLDKGDEEGQQVYREMMEDVKGKDLTDEDIKSLGEKIELTSFMDYIVIETFFSNRDWLFNNTSWFRASPDHKWRWLLNDLDYSMAYPGPDNLTYNTFNYMAETPTVTSDLFFALMTNSGFKSEFKSRAVFLLENFFNQKAVETEMTRLQNQYEPEVERTRRRWRMFDSVSDWEEACQKNLQFLLDRPAIYLEQIEAL